MLHKKRIVFLLFVLFLCFNQKSFSNIIFQDTISQFDKVAFKASLEKLEPKEFARLFIQQYKQDSLKAVLCIAYIEDTMLQSEDLLTQFWGNYSLAYWEHDQMNQENSIFYIEKINEIAIKLKDDDLILSSLINKGVFYYEFGDYKESMELNLEALELAKNSKNLKRELAVLLNIALIKLQTNDNLGAIELLKKNIEGINSGAAGKLIPLRTKVYIAFIKGYIGVEDYEQAKIYSEKAINLSRNNKDKESEFYGLSFLGTIERINKNYEKAHQLLDESLVIAEEIKAVTQEIPLIYFEKGEVFYEEKKFEDAIAILLKAETLMQKHKLDFIKLEEAYALLAKSYNEIGDIKSSVKFYEKANDAYKKNDKRQGSISVDIIKKYDLKSLKEELNLAEKKTQNTKTILYVSVFSALLMVIGLIYFYKKREKENQRKFTAILTSLEEEKEQIAETKKESLEEHIIKEVVQLEKKIEATPAKEVEIIDETKEKLLKKLQNFETKELYLSKNSSLNEVAKKLKTNTSYLSKLVNAHKGKSFTAYITDLRVNYAIRRLKEDKKFRSYTIDSIAREIGFNRSESFSRAFKNKTGLYPSYYIKSLDNQNVV